MDVVFKTDEGVFNYRVAGIWIQDNHVLLHKNVNDNHWALPGGRVNMMETSKLAVIREFQEELGVDIEVDRFLWSTENFFTFHASHFHEIGFYYLIKAVVDYEISPTPFTGLEGENLIYQWFPVAELEDILLYPGFLKSGIMHLPNETEHVVIYEITELGSRME